MDMRRAMPHFEKAEALLAKQPESVSHAMFYFSKLSACWFGRRIGEGLAAGSARWKSASAWTSRP
jgi:hypothetical protein